MIALNPYAFMLEKKENRFFDLKTKAVYKNGPYACYKYADRYYVTCRGNIIITETTGIPKELIKCLVSDKEPEDYSRYHYRRMVDAYEKGLDYAKQVDFAVITE